MATALHTAARDSALLVAVDWARIWRTVSHHGETVSSLDCDDEFSLENAPVLEQCDFSYSTYSFLILRLKKIASFSSDDREGNENIISNITYCFCISMFAIIEICSTWKMLANCPGTKLLWTVLKQRKREKTLSSCVYVLEKTQLKFGHFMLLFVGDGTKMYQNVKARAEWLILLIKPYVLSSSRCHCHCRCCPRC